ncbi:hypothetical protein PIB30_019950 [Stylosanthes scabra]|uniref:Uncharacterized protein n=1 Tax=Stylosanthes scabra TaxID=79078 RepID=A0ABU6X6J2_9FABA|nr:hypothetical protein [Stylosanthes scabra]
MFVKVTCSEDQFPFHLEEFGLERFPLYWYSKPVQILSMAKLKQESTRVVEFLENNVCMKEVLSLNMVFKWDREREDDYWGFEEFLQEQAERGHLASNIIKTEEGVVVNKPAEKKSVPSMKRRRAEEGGSGKEKPCCGKEVSLEDVKQITEKQRRLHGYGGEEDLTSVWSEHFPISVVAEEHFQSKTNLDLIGSVHASKYEELKAREEASQKKEQMADMQKMLELERKLQASGE